MSTVVLGRFPQFDLPANSLQGILLSQVAHYLSPEEIESGFRNAHLWLKPSGKLVLMAMSPYADNFNSVREHLGLNRLAHEGVESWQSWKDRTNDDEKRPSSAELFPLYLPRMRGVGSAVGIQHLHTTGITDEAMREAGFVIERASNYSTKTVDDHEYREEPEGEYCGVVGRCKKR